MQCSLARSRTLGCSRALTAGGGGCCGGGTAGVRGDAAQVQPAGAAPSGLTPDPSVAPAE
eukprot:3330977-Rhodomonas_salina.1